MFHSSGICGFDDRLVRNGESAGAAVGSNPIARSFALGGAGASFT
jgi:hypothetical protein